MTAAAPLLSTGDAAPPPGGEAFWLKTADGVRLRAAFWRDGGRGVVLLLGGRTEFIEKYYETIERFRGLGFAVATLDWRGQGLSDRPLPDPRKGHVDGFDAYQRDLDALSSWLVETQAPTPWLIAAHSMGGAVAARRLMRLEAQADQRVRAALLSAPMLGLQGAAGRFTGRWAAALAVWLGWGAGYAPGGGPIPFAETTGFDANPLTTDRRRFGAFAAFLREHPDLALGGATWSWLRAAQREMARLRPTPRPTLILLGDEDAVVSHAAIERYARSGVRCSVTRLAAARHEPFIESAAVQERLWDAVSAFLDEAGV